jgi:hypothetical protein
MSTDPTIVLFPAGAEFGTPASSVELISEGPSQVEYLATFDATIPDELALDLPPELPGQTSIDQILTPVVGPDLTPSPADIDYGELPDLTDDLSGAA